MPLLDMFDARSEQIYKTRRSQLSPVSKAILDGWLADVFEHYAALWESTRGDQRWDQKTTIQLGIRRNWRGNTSRISGAYKREVMIETRNAVGSGVRTPRQLLIGIACAERTTPAKRLGFQQRMLLKRRRGPDAATSQKRPRGTADGKRGSDFELFEQYNYYSDCRRGLRFVLTYCIEHN